MFDLFGAETPTFVRFLIAFIVVFALIGAAAWLLRRFGASSLGGAAARGRQPRLAVIEAGVVDNRRKLVIVRRDNVEHLIMIGGPTDILIEANIVRGQAANREVAASRGTGTTETLSRAIPLDDAATAFPLAPEPGSPRTRPAVLDESLQWNLQPEPVPAPVVSAPPPVPRRPARQPDTLAGLAQELSRPNGHSEPSIPAPRKAPPIDISAIRPAAPSLDIPAAKPAAPQVQPAAPAVASDTGDQNLAEMAQRLEAALRRPGGAPAVKPVTATPSSSPAPNPALASEPRIDSVNGTRDKAAKPEPAAASDQGGAIFGSLEQEMASLLGRPSGKA